MRINKLGYYTESSDERGCFRGLINQGKWAEINVVETRSGAVRGRHYHKHTREVVFILKGEVEVELQSIREEGLRKRLLLRQGEGILLSPEVFHVMRYTQDTVQISLLDQAFDPEHPDLHGLPQ